MRPYALERRLGIACLALVVAATPAAAETIQVTIDKLVFSPATVEAKQGDVVRYTLGQGVHNVHFLPDSNPNVQGLPPASEMLQLPGQTYDVKVTFAPGTYYFQCDPHAALGMKGHLIVE